MLNEDGDVVALDQRGAVYRPRSVLRRDEHRDRDFRRKYDSNEREPCLSDAALSLIALRRPYLDQHSGDLRLPAC